MTGDLSWIMITYADGTIAQIGDNVDFDGYPAVVDDVIDSPELTAKWGLVKDEYGLMFKADQFGLVFEGPNSSSWDSIVLLSRRDARGLAPGVSPG